jgi:hypothetical protein
VPGALEAALEHRDRSEAARGNAQRRRLRRPGESARLVALGVVGVVAPRNDVGGLAAKSPPTAARLLPAAVRAELLQLGEILPGARDAPSSTIACPALRARRGRWARAERLVGERIALPYSFCFFATRARFTKAERLRGSTASAVSSRSAASMSLPARSAPRACCCKLDRQRRDLIIGTLADDRARDHRDRSSSKHQKTHRNSHHSLHRSRPAPSMA